MSKVGASKKAKRREVEFEFNPPRCCSCVHFDPPVFGVPQKKYYKQPTCKKNGFEVKPISICNLWESSKGEVLDLMELCSEVTK